MKQWIARAIILAACSTQAAFAHEAEARHGGIVRSVDDVQYELVSRDNKTVIYVDDHDKPVATAGASGKLTVLNGAKKEEFVLKPAAENQLQVEGAAQLKAGAKAVAAITFADKKKVQVRFVVK
ncbi:hypothetical protein V8J88_08000 [Massilia sp. W12]|uniref:hypothetical protein n=1 Tax=Massilia sp. W12 TaxID=3126507 RepID=UPI0030D31838